MFFEPINAVTWKPMHFQLLDHYIQFRPPPLPRIRVLYQNMQSLQCQSFWTKLYDSEPFQDPKFYTKICSPSNLKDSGPKRTDSLPPLEPTFHTKISTYSDLHLDKSIPFRVSLDPKFYTKICSHSDQASRPKFKCCVPFTHEPHFWTKIHLGRNLERNKCSPCFRP